MFLHCIFYFEEWKKSTKIDELPIIVLQSWMSKDDSDISVFEINDENDTKRLNNIAVRLFFRNQKMYNTINFLILKNDLINNIPNIVLDSKEKIGCLHGNIPNAKYKDFVKCIEYTLSHIKEVITYPSSAIGNIFRSMSDQQFTDFLDELDDKNKENKKQIAKSVKKYFFQGDEESAPKYLN